MHAETWGDQVAVEVVGNAPYGMYPARPRQSRALINQMDKWIDRSHIVHGDRVLYFEQVHRMVGAKARAIRSAGVNPGAHVFLLCWNSPELIANFWARVHAGVAPVLANAWWSAAKITNDLTSMHHALALEDATCAEHMPSGAALRICPISSEGGGVSDATPESHSKGHDNDAAVVIFTSGKSGQPKAVLLSHCAMLARLQITLHVTRKLRKSEVLVGDTPILQKGRFNTGEVLELTKRHCVKRWAAVPTVVSRLLAHPHLYRRDRSSLKSIRIGGAQLQAGQWQRIRAQVPSVSPGISTGYRLTEKGGQSTDAGGTEDVNSLGPSGKALSCVGNCLLEHRGTTNGEVPLRSPIQMSSYVRFDEQGNLGIDGRCKGVVIRGGENISPEAFERVLQSLPDLVEVAPFSVPHADLAEEVSAVVMVDRDLDPVQPREGLPDWADSAAFDELPSGNPRRVEYPHD